jgi:hypothetical protein
VTAPDELTVECLACRRNFAPRAGMLICRHCGADNALAEPARQDGGETPDDVQWVRVQLVAHDGTAFAAGRVLAPVTTGYMAYISFDPPQPFLVKLEGVEAP